MPDVVLNNRLAFPTAKGFGRNTIGGRGGQIIHVTNLNDSGTGSLRAALQTTGTRTIVFDVGGSIQLANENWLQIGSTNYTQNVALENITIAGETAPFPGITITGGGFDIYTSNVIIRNITIRCNIPTVEKNDAIRIRNWGVNGYVQENIIVDSCSLSHGSDENFNVDGASASSPLRNVTLQNSILGSNFQQQKNILKGSYVQNFSMIYNYLSHCWDRNPLLGYGTTSPNGNVEIINNIVYGGGIAISYQSIVDVISNIYRQPPSQPYQYNIISYGSQGYPGTPINTIHLDGNITFGPLQTGASYYSSDAVTYNNPSRRVTNSNITTWFTDQTDIENHVFENVGPLYRDNLDSLWINNYLNNTGGNPNLNYSVVTKPLTSHSANFYVSNPDIPETFVQAHGITSNNQIITNWDFGTYTVTNNAGYTAFEMYLAYMAKDLDKLANTTSVTQPPIEPPIVEQDSRRFLKNANNIYILT